MTKIKRKLTTILATDCVSFSRHMQGNEVATLNNLNACREIIDAEISAHGGRIFHTAGDSVIADFDSPVECVNAALKFQEAIYLRNKGPEIEPKLEWRVGIHVDDVIIEGDNIYGTGVNIAARLESQCDAGGILVSRVVREQVEKKVNFSIESAGTRTLKNIDDNYEVFLVATSAATENGKIKASSQAAETNENAGPSAQTAAHKKPTLAVIPFENASGNDDNAFLVGGIVEDLITEFSMLRQFDVISRQSSTNFDPASEDALAFAERFGINFLVSGGIRSSGSRIRINVELTDTATGSAVWSNKYDRVMDDIFDIQDEIVRKISIALLGEIEITSLQRSKRKPTDNFNSYELLLRGRELHHRFSAEACAQAINFFDKAIALDQGNAQAHAWKACTLGQSLARNYLDRDFEEIYAELMTHLNQALYLNENDFECHRMLSAVFLSTHDFQKSEEHARKAFQLNPNDPRVLSGVGEVLVRVGDHTDGLEMLRKAIEVDPIPMGQSNSDNRLRDLTLGYFCASDFESCAETAIRINDLEPRSWLFLMWALTQTSADVQSNSAYIGRKAEYANLDWPATIERFHLVDEGKIKELEAFAETLF